MSRTEAEIISDYEASVMSGLAFRRHAASLRSIHGYHPPTGSTRYGAAIRGLACLAGDRRFTDMFGRLVDRMNPWQTPGETAASMWEAAAATLDDGWFDTLNAASPEPGRHSDNEHEYTLRDRLYLLAVLQQANVALGADHQASPGWCWSALTEREAEAGRPVRIPAVAR